jgi:hypothetical protein
MNVFVGWPYDAVWVERYAIPLIKTYGINVTTGKEIPGLTLQKGVRQRIKDANAAIFFTTRREQDPNNEKVWKTSDWVVAEINYAKGLEKERILDMREEGVEYAEKLFEERQHVIMDPDDRLQSLIDLGEALNQWRSLDIRLRLLPEEFLKALRQRLPQSRYTGEYSIRRLGRRIHGPKKAEIIQEDRGYYVMYAHDLPAAIFAYSDAFIELSVNIGDQWVAYGIPLNSLEVTLEKV